MFKKVIQLSVVVLGLMSSATAMNVAPTKKQLMQDFQDLKQQRAVLGDQPTVVQIANFCTQCNTLKARAETIGAQTIVRIVAQFKTRTLKDLGQ